MSMTYMPTSADTLFVLWIFRSLILVHSFIMRWRADFLFLVRGNDNDSSSSNSSSSFWTHEPDQQYFIAFVDSYLLQQRSEWDGPRSGTKLYPNFNPFSALFSAWTISSSNSVLSANLKNPLGSCCFQIGRWRRKTNRKLLLVSK